MFQVRNYVVPRDKNGNKLRNTSVFQQDIGGMAACMKVFTESNKGCGQLSSNETFFDYIWFIGSKTAENENEEGVDYCGTFNTSQKRFFLATLKIIMKEWLTGFHIFMNSSLRVSGDKTLRVII